MLLQTHSAKLASTRSFSAPVRCPHCDDWMVAPVVSEFVLGYRIVRRRRGRNRQRTGAVAAARDIARRLADGALGTRGLPHRPGGDCVSWRIFHRVIW